MTFLSSLSKSVSCLFSDSLQIRSRKFWGIYLTSSTSWAPTGVSSVFVLPGPLSQVMFASKCFALFCFGSRKRVSSKKERSEEHTSELQSHLNLVCRLL